MAREMTVLSTYIHQCAPPHTRARIYAHARNVRVRDINRVILDVVFLMTWLGRGLTFYLLTF